MSNSPQDENGRRPSIIKKSSIFGSSASPLSSNVNATTSTVHRSKIPIYGSNGKIVTDENKVKNEPDVSSSGLSTIDTSEAKLASANVSVDFKKFDRDSETDEEDSAPVPSNKSRRLIRKMEYDDQFRRKPVISDDEEEDDEVIRVPKRISNIQETNESRSVSPSSTHVKKSFTSKDALGRTKLQKSCIKGNLELVKELIKNGANVNQPDHAGNTPLHEAALNGHYEIAKVLIENGANVNVQNGVDDLDTPLIDACAYNRIKIIELLLQNGADPTLKNAMGQNAMDSIDQDEDGAQKLTKLIKESLLKFGYKEPPLPQPNVNHHLATDMWIDLTTKEGRDEIYHRAADGDEAFVGNYLANGGKPHPKLLIFLARHGHSNVVSLLLAFGAKIEKSVEGETALSQTVGRGHYDTVLMLLDNGANPTRKNNKGVSVLDRARDPNLINDPKEIALLENAAKNFKDINGDKKMKRKNSEESANEQKKKVQKVEKPKESTLEEIELLKQKEELRIKREAEEEEKRKLELEEAELQRKRELEEAEIKRKRELEEAEIRRKRELEEAEIRLKRELEEAEIKRKRELEEAELRRKRELEEEALRKIRDAELQKQREQWESHKRAQREAKAADIMRSIEINKKRREEEEKKLELKKIQEQELVAKREREAKLAEEKLIKESILKEEIEKRKLIREYYVPGLKNTTFNNTRTKEELLMFLPLYVNSIDDKDYVCDLQVILLLGVADFGTRFSHLSRTKITESDKAKLWRFYFPIIGIEHGKVMKMDEIEKLRSEGLAKFQTYELNWLLLEEVKKIFEQDEFGRLELVNSSQVKIELDIDTSIDVRSIFPLGSNGNEKPKAAVVNERSIPYKFRGNKKFMEILSNRNRKLF